MQLFVMRHGHASSQAPSDMQRPLTEQGLLETSVMAQWLLKSKLSVEQVLVSPYLRAQQTAKRLMDDANIVTPLQTLSIITPNGRAGEVHDYLDGICALEHSSSTLIVSHMPLVSYLVAELTEDHQAPIFQTAAIAHIDYDCQRMKGRLVQLVAPADLC